jgi:hypothetical protein
MAQSENRSLSTLLEYIYVGPNQLRFIGRIITRMSMKSEISIAFRENSISTGREVQGRIDLNYLGRFDSIVINSQIEKSNDIFNYTSLNGKRILHPYARLSIFKDDIGSAKILEFTAVTKHIPSSEDTTAKFRVAIIQEHKEVASDVAYIRITR